MAKKVQYKIELNRQGVRELLQSAEMMDVCKEYAYRAKAKLGDGYEVSYQKGKNRVNASIAAVSRKAKRENLVKNTVLKAVKGVSND